MNRTTALAARVRSWGGAHARGGLTRILALGLLGVLLVPLLMTAFAPSAFADDEERDNYSLYQLASNASTYFSQENSPEGSNDPAERMTDQWRSVASDPATGGDMLGYADSEFSLGNIVGWLFAEISGSSQTIGYGTLTATDVGEGTDIYAGMLDYAHFGAANADLGLDTMSSGIGGQIMGMIGGSVIWVLYALALAVGMLFYLIIQLLKLINPFLWFGQAVSAINQTFGEGMTRGQDAPAALQGLSNFVDDWYGLLNDIAWQALVPLFVGFLLIGLVLFKKMDRGSAVKKLIVRIVFLGVGLPLLGSMYTGVLDKFDDSLMGQHSGPTRVVLSTYVDFEAWAMKDRLGIPDDATIAWADGQASSDAMMSVRTSALAINKQSHGSTYADINIGTKADNAESAWHDGMTGVDRTATDDVYAVFTTFGIIGNYITSNVVAASDFESGIKSAITKLGVDKDVKKEWFVNKKGYGDLDKFGEETAYGPTNHPVLSVSGQGLTSSNPGGTSTTFKTQGTKSGCGFAVWNNGPVSCNLSALSTYNYLNTGFGPDSLTMYSSNNATSGFTRENHMAVSQVGTGPAKFMYWHNAGTVLGSIALLGFWYAIGMLFGAVKRTFSLVAAIPFATLGAIAAISKVIVYSTALILEVIVTLFIYQFVSEFLISIPDIIAGPMSNLMSPDGLFGSAVLGGIVVVILTLISSLLVMGVTFGLLRVRKVVLQAMDEVFTKLVDKFLETSTAPKPDKGGMLPALAAGAGAGAGMAMGNKLASGLGSKIGGGTKSPGGNGPGGRTTPTNAGGTNGEQTALSTGAQTLALEGGGKPGGDGPDGAGLNGGGDGPGRGGSDGDLKALPGGSGPEGTQGARGGDDDKGGPLQLTSGSKGSSRSDKKTAQSLSSRGGLSNLGYSHGPQMGSGDVQGGQTHFGIGPVPGSTTRSGHDAPDGSDGPDTPAGTRGGHRATAGSSKPTQFGTGQQPDAPASRGTASQGSGKSARFAVGSDGLAQPNPGRTGARATPGAQGGTPVPGTRSTRAAQGQRPQGQLGPDSPPAPGGQGQQRPQGPVPRPLPPLTRTSQPQAQTTPVPPGGLRVPPYVASPQALRSAGWPTTMPDAQKARLERQAAAMKLPTGTLPTPAQMRAQEQGRTSAQPRRAPAPAPASPVAPVPQPGPDGTRRRERRNKPES
ncbi:hypothetical protein [Streptomyces sp. MMS24-I29]|uniref:hypothetical protein n=1 Tax=Streptomyces sp. MMS24-I29 TaxID=3351480 RepID=UPI003C7CC319